MRFWPIVSCLACLVSCLGGGDDRDGRQLCDAERPCSDDLVCVWDNEAGEGRCARPCGSCTAGESCRDCLASGECPACQVCVAACW